MFKLHPVRQVRRRGLHEHLVHAQRRLRAARALRTSLGVPVGGTTADGMFTLEEVECSAACTVAPAVQVNYRYQEKRHARGLRRPGGRSCAPVNATTSREHGTLAKVRQTPTDRWADTGRTESTANDRPHGHPEDRQPPLRRRRRAHARRLPPHRRLRGPQEGAGDDARPKSSTSSAAPPLQGRGGAGFPAGNKWKLLDTTQFPRWIVVNGDESEPGTHKDRTLMERDPHMVIEGALITAYACKAQPGLPLRARRDGARPGAHRAGA